MHQVGSAILADTGAAQWLEATYACL